MHVRKRIGFEREYPGPVRSTRAGLSLRATKLDLRRDAGAGRASARGLPDRGRGIRLGRLAMLRPGDHTRAENDRDCAGNAKLYRSFLFSKSIDGADTGLSGVPIRWRCGSGTHR